MQVAQSPALSLARICPDQVGWQLCPHILSASLSWDHFARLFPTFTFSPELKAFVRLLCSPLLPRLSLVLTLFQGM